MYKQPENCNRVKSMKSRFETTKNESCNLKKQETESIKSHRDSVKCVTQNLSRQLSDPSRRNVKRTPAFRIDINAEKNNIFQRNSEYNRSFYLERVQQYNTALKNTINTDNQKDVIKTENVQNKFRISNDKSPLKESYQKQTLIKSKSSIDFSLIRSKFEGNKQDDKSTTKTQSDEAMTNKTEITEDTVSCLYAKPIPKVLQKDSKNDKINKTENCSVVKANKEINTFEKLDLEENHTSVKEHRISYLYAKPIPKSLQNTSEEKQQVIDLKNDIYCDIQPNVEANTEILEIKSDGLTDTLKAALKKPLPNGPAPQKPPRTFEHNMVTDSPKNLSFLHHDRRKEQKNEKKEHNQKHDPRYMLNKLETALRNNKIQSKRRINNSTKNPTGSNSLNRLQSSPNSSYNSHFLSNFDCFNHSTYERIREPNSTFFVDNQVEPVYAEPWHDFDDNCKTESENVERNQRVKSLYYMSTSLLNDDENCHIKMDTGITQQDSTDKSSLSSATSNSETGLEPAYDINNKSTDNHSNIKQLINTFESGQIANPSKKEDCRILSDRSHQIEELKLSLHKTLKKCFDDENGEQDSSERLKVDTIINKFQDYVKTMPKYQKLKFNKDDSLFYCCLIVGWDQDKPNLKLKYPPNVLIPRKIEDLCYPEAASGPLDISDNAQCYSLVITNDKGERLFGYCRRVIPEGSTKCIPLTYCLLSKHRAPRFFKKILIELESRHGVPDKLRDEFINKLYHNKFPRPGESVRIDLTPLFGDSAISKHDNKLAQRIKKNSESETTNLGDFVHVNLQAGQVVEVDNGSKSTEILGVNKDLELILTLHHDTRYEEADLKQLHQLPSNILLKIFASLLLERKVILISCVISKLSSCVDALQSILYPFSWPHTFIPILPQCLWEVVESPTPVICGILSVSVVNDHRIEHGIVVDLDERSIISQEGDEDNILSESMKKAWYQGMTLANTMSPDHYVHSVYLSDAYIKVFIISLKHYKNHIQNNKFEKESFIKCAKSKGIRTFLKWFTETTMFITFITAVISNPESFSLFDQKIEMYGSNESNLILTKLRDWKK